MVSDLPHLILGITALNTLLLVALLIFRRKGDKGDTGVNGMDGYTRFDARQINGLAHLIAKRTAERMRRMFQPGRN